jgi:hypothetical protein
MSRDQKIDPPSSGTKERKVETEESCILLKKGKEVELGTPESCTEKKDEDK